MTVYSRLLFLDQRILKVSSGAENNAIACPKFITKTLAPVHKKKKESE